MKTVLSKIRSALIFLGSRVFAHPYLPDALSWAGLFLGATGVSLILIAQPYFYWFDFQRAQFPVDFIAGLLKGNPLVFLGIGILYLAALWMIYKLFTRSLAFLVWLPVSFINLFFFLIWFWGRLFPGIMPPAGVQESLAGGLAIFLLALFMLFFLFRRQVSDMVQSRPWQRRAFVLLYGVWGILLIGGVILSALHPWPGWQLLQTVHSPGPRSQSAVAYDPDSKSTILFGGVSESLGYENYYHNDTWAWDGKDWKQLHPKNSPSPRSGQTMTYDQKDHVVILFGGEGPGQYSLGDTWLWDGQNWTAVATDNHPDSRIVPVMFYDPLLEKVILAGGYAIYGATQTTNDYQDVWAWDGKTWMPLPAEPVNAYLRSPATIYDSTLQQTLVMNYTGLWAWQDSQWSLKNMSPTPSARLDTWMASDSNGDALLFGGKMGTTLMNDTWLLRSGHWQPINPVAVPAPRYTHVLFYDPVSRGFILYGGLDSQGNFLADTWAFSMP